jgi:purine-binding chemotaxis protein CheW
VKVFRLNPDCIARISFLQLESRRVLLAFHLVDQIAALPLNDVERIVPMAQLARPPGLPPLMEGVLNLAGKAVPVLRLGRLLELPAQSPGLYSMLIVLKAAAEGQIALLVDRVTGVLSVPENALVATGKEGSFNACTEATTAIEGQPVHLLSPTRILLEKERVCVSHFQSMEQRRLQDCAQGGP